MDFKIKGTLGIIKLGISKKLLVFKQSLKVLVNLTVVLIMETETIHSSAF